MTSFVVYVVSVHNHELTSTNRIVAYDVDIYVDGTNVTWKLHKFSFADFIWKCCLIVKQLCRSCITHGMDTVDAHLLLVHVPEESCIWWQ